MYIFGGIYEVVVYSLDIMRAIAIYNTRHARQKLKSHKAKASSDLLTNSEN